MATRTYTGGEAAVAQVTTVTPDNVETDDRFEIELSDELGNTYAIAFTATAATAQNVVEGLQSAAAAAKSAGIDPWAAITATEDGTSVTLTADRDGEPFHVTTRVTDGGGSDDQTLTASTTTAASGPKILTGADNWDAALAAGDDIRIPAWVTGQFWGCDMGDDHVNSLLVEDGCEATFGSRDYPIEWEATGQADQTMYWGGTATAWFDLQDFDGGITVTNGGTASGAGLHISGTGNGEVVFHPPSDSVRLGIADWLGGSAEITGLTQSGGNTTIGRDVATPTATAPDTRQSGGTVTSWSSLDDVDRTGGDHYQRAGAIGDLDDWSDQGTTYYWSGETLASADIGPSAALDLSQGSDVTITALTLHGGATLNDPLNLATLTALAFRQVAGTGHAKITTGTLGT